RKGPPMIRRIPLLLGLLIAGCADIDAARRVQDPANRRSGERTVSAEEVGLGAGTVLSLDKGIAIALKNNPIVAASRARSERSVAVLEQVNSGYLPDISVSANYRWQKAGGAGTPPPTGSKIKNSGITQSHGGSVQINQLITDFGKTDAAHRQAYANYAASLADLAAAENDAVF